MKFDSPYFDRIRVKPDEDRLLRASNPVCDWRGCNEAATHRAPKGRLRENEYWRFCLAHTREYNQSYNYFAGMSDDAVAQFQKESLVGHRPTWKIGMNGPINSRGKRGFDRDSGLDDANDPFNVFGELGGRGRPNFEARHPEGRVLRNAERKALDTLGLERTATAHEVKMRFKMLVKRHHPDTNGGDRSTEDKLREIIQAYNYLKSVKFG
jgi:curved DNA-binding protein CbpA